MGACFDDSELARILVASAGQRQTLSVVVRHHFQRLGWRKPPSGFDDVGDLIRRRVRLRKNVGSEGQVRPVLLRPTERMVRPVDHEVLLHAREQPG